MKNEKINSIENPMDSMVVSYLDLKEVAKTSTEISTKVSKLWLKHFNEELQDILECLTVKEEDKNLTEEELIAKSKQDIENAKRAFLDSLKKSQKITLDTTDMIAQEAARLLIDGYSVGFAEGAKQSSDLMVETIRKLIADGLIIDQGDKLEKFLEITKHHNAANYDEMMKGRTMHLYTNPRAGEKENGDTKK